QRELGDREVEIELAGAVERPPEQLVDDLRPAPHDAGEAAIEHGHADRLEDLPAHLQRPETAGDVALPWPQQIAATEQLRIGHLADAHVAGQDAVEHEVAHEAGLALGRHRPRTAWQRDDTDDQPAAHLL